MVPSDQDGSGVLGKYVLLYLGNIYYRIWEIYTTIFGKYLLLRENAPFHIYIRSLGNMCVLYLFLYIFLGNMYTTSLSSEHD